MDDDFESLLENFDLSARLRQSHFDIDASVAPDYRGGIVETPGLPSYTTPRNLEATFDGIANGGVPATNEAREINDNDSDSDSEPLMIIAQPSVMKSRMHPSTPTRIYSSRSRANVKNDLLDDSFSDTDEFEDDHTVYLSNDAHPSAFSSLYCGKNEDGIVAISREAAESTTSKLHQDFANAAHPGTQNPPPNLSCKVESSASDCCMLRDRSMQGARRKANQRIKQIHIKQCPDGSIDSRFRTVNSETSVSKLENYSHELLPSVSKTLIPRRVKKKAKGQAKRESKKKGPTLGHYCYDCNGHKIMYTEKNQQIVPKILSQLLPNVGKTTLRKKEVSLRHKNLRTCKKYHTKLEANHACDEDSHTSLPQIDPPRKGISRQTGAQRIPSYAMALASGSIDSNLSSFPSEGRGWKERAMYEAGCWKSRSHEEVSQNKSQTRSDIGSSENKPPRLVV